MGKNKEPGIGHNSFSSEKLKSYVKRLESLIGDRKAAQEDIKDVMLEAKVAGYDPKAIREVIKVRASDREKWLEFEDMKKLYLESLGLL